MAINFSQMKIFSRNKFLLIFVAILTAAVIWQIMAKSQKNQVTYETAPAEKGTLITSISASGNVTTANIQEVTTQASGVVRQLNVEDGQKVVKGQKIAELELDLVGSQRFASAYSSYLAAQKGVNSANNSYRSSQSSLAVVYDEIKGHDSDETLLMKEKRTKAEVANDNAYDGMLTAKAHLSSAYLSYNQSSPAITSPASGVVKMSVVEGSQLSSAGSSVDASNTRIATINTDGLPIVNVSVSEVDVTQVKTGQKATLTFDSIEDLSFTGKVVAVDNLGTSTSGVVTYSVIIRLDEKSNLILPNMAVSAQIITSIKPEVLMIPSSAVNTADGASSVQVKKDGQITSVQVDTGSSNDTMTEITSGISEGDEVVTSVITPDSGTSGESAVSPFSGLGRSGTSTGGREFRMVFPGGP